MPTPPTDPGSEKRKRPADAFEPRKKPGRRPQPLPQPPTVPSLLRPHEATVGALQAKYDVLVASVISSTQIRKRVEMTVARLAATVTTEPGKPRIVLLHARTAQVCKMITIAEQSKRFLAKDGKFWHQYNELFDLPVEPDRPDVVEETRLDKDGESADVDNFEVMANRFEKAVLPCPRQRIVKSLRVFLAIQPIPELETKNNVTTQTSGPPKA